MASAGVDTGVDNGMSCAPGALQRRLREAYHQAYHHRQRVLLPPRLLGLSVAEQKVRRRRSRSAPPLAPPPSSAPPDRALHGPQAYALGTVIGRYIYRRLCSRVHWTATMRRKAALQTHSRRLSHQCRATTTPTRAATKSSDQEQRRVWRCASMGGAGRRSRRRTHDKACRSCVSSLIVETVHACEP
jgi:hypothetical protein